MSSFSDQVETHNSDAIEVVPPRIDPAKLRAYPMLGQLLSPEGPLTPGERKTLEWQLGHTGGFFTRLFEMMTIADDTNLRRLAYGFPEYVQGYLSYMDGTLTRKCQQHGVDL